MSDSQRNVHSDVLRVTRSVITLVVRTRLLPRTCSRSRDRGRREYENAAIDTIAGRWARGGRLRRLPADDRVETVRVRTSERNGTLLRVRVPISRHVVIVG